MKYKTHYQDPYFNEEREQFCCGVYVSEGIDYLELSRNWENVTCKRCLKSKDKIMKNIENTEIEIIRQYGDMADYYCKEK